MQESTYPFSLMNYSLVQRSVWQTELAATTTTLNTEINRERPRRRHVFFFFSKNDNPSIHMPYAKHCILFPISSGDCSNQTRGEARRGEVMMVFRARKEEKCMKTELCRTPLSGVLKQTAVVLRSTHSPVHKHTHQPTKINLCAASYHLIKVAQ